MRESGRSRLGARMPCAAAARQARRAAGDAGADRSDRQNAVKRRCRPADAGGHRRLAKALSASGERRTRELHHHGLLPRRRRTASAQRGRKEGAVGSVRQSADGKDLLSGQSRAISMEAMLGFRVDFWDYVTFGAIAVIVFAGLGLAVFVLGLPGRIAIARNHREADAVNLMGWVGFVA